MPSTYAHYRFGQEVRSGLPEALQALIRSNLDLYYLGLHGPDLLFYDHPLWSTPVNRVGFGTDRPGQAFSPGGGLLPPWTASGLSLRLSVSLCSGPGLPRLHRRKNRRQRRPAHGDRNGV